MPEGRRFCNWLSLKGRVCGAKEEAIVNIQDILVGVKFWVDCFEGVEWCDSLVEKMEGRQFVVV